MTRRQYPYYAGRERYRGKPNRCACCDAPGTHSICIQLSIFRGDDEEYLVCGSHSVLARTDYDAFVEAAELRRAHLSERIQAKHEVTGRMWSGERRNLPPRYFVLPESEEATNG